MISGVGFGKDFGLTVLEGKREKEREETEGEKRKRKLEKGGERGRKRESRAIGSRAFDLEPPKARAISHPRGRREMPGARC